MIDDVRVYNRALFRHRAAELGGDSTPDGDRGTPTSASTSASNMPTVTATFTQPVQASTIKFTLTNSSGTSVPGQSLTAARIIPPPSLPNRSWPTRRPTPPRVSGAENCLRHGHARADLLVVHHRGRPGLRPERLTGEYIQTDLNTIPNYGYNPTVVSVASGSWSSGSTWSTGQVPGAGAIVSIASGTTVTYDANSTAVLSAITIQPGGTLQFATNVNTEVIAADYLVLPGGTLDVGTQANPIAPNVTATIETANQTINTTFDPSQYGDSLDRTRQYHDLRRLQDAVRATRRRAPGRRHHLVPWLSRSPAGKPATSCTCPIPDSLITPTILRAAITCPNRKPRPSPASLPTA